VWDDDSGGNELWWEEFPALLLLDGYYTVTLGETDPLDWATGTGDRHLEIAVGGVALSPRQQLVSVPFALTAQNVVGDITPSSIWVNGQQIVNSQGVWVGPGAAGGGGGFDAETLDDLDSTDFVTKDELELELTGLDADTLDTLHASKFLRTDQNTGTSGALSAARFDIGVGDIQGGGRAWMNLGLRVGKTSDNAYFGMKDEGNNDVDTVVAWGDDDGDDLRFIFARSGGALEGEEFLRVTSAGKVGIGTNAPAELLEVSGTARVTLLSTPKLKLDKLLSPTADCDAAAEGSLRYNASAKVLEFCNGATWSSVRSGGSGGPGEVPDPGTLCDGLVANWRLDEAAGAIQAADVMGTHHGTLVNNPAWTVGKVGGAISFNGSGYVNVPDNNALDPRLGNFSVAAWIRIAVGQKGQRRIVAHGSHGWGGYDGWSLMQSGAWAGTANGSVALIFAADGKGEYMIATPSAMDDGQWHHYVVTFQRNGFVELYVDGLKLAAPSYGVGGGAAWNAGIAGNIAHLASEDLNCPCGLGMGASIQNGGPCTGPSEGFTGLLDEVAYYNRLLTAGEVAALYNNGAGRQTCVP
ncbi:MAG: LamG domain-containing protein, partial [Deltaproteobacteria bacterium]|nr:LamG domain-containing protein [Deltaproteobacteria bacterium]